MYTPHIVTIFNIGAENPETFTQPISATVLSGVLLDASKAVNVQRSGLESADSVNLYIPLSVSATDAITGEAKHYADPKQYVLLDFHTHWTLSTTDCFFVKGIVTEIADFQTINKKYDDVYKVTKVDKKDFGTPDMQHWEVGGA